MSNVTQTITLMGPHHYGRRLPPQAVGHALTAIPVVVRQSVSMAFRGRSSVVGPRPRWLKAAADIRFVGHDGDDASVLYFEAPTLGQAAKELYQQQEFWSTRPEPSLTGLDLFGDVVRDVAARNEDSDRFDNRLLANLVGLKYVLNGTFHDLQLDTNRPDTPLAVINTQVIQTAQEFRETTPPPQRIRVVGALDMVRASTQSFALRLDDGQEARGVLVAGSILDAATFLNRRVLVLGRAIYRASGRLLRIDADEIRDAEGETSLWSRIPAPKTRGLDPSSLRVPQGPRSGVSAIIGRWPGDETDEEIAAWLERNS
ncbi:MAG: hypothetical protein ACLQIB_07265 [Isosphaeraceae bacterium]